MALRTCQSSSSDFALVIDWNYLCNTFITTCKSFTLAPCLHVGPGCYILTAHNIGKGTNNWHPSHRVEDLIPQAETVSFDSSACFSLCSLIKRSRHASCSLSIVLYLSVSRPYCDSSAATSTHLAMRISSMASSAHW